MGHTLQRIFSGGDIAPSIAGMFVCNSDLVRRNLPSHIFVATSFSVSIASKGSFKRPGLCVDSYRPSHQNQAA